MPNVKILELGEQETKKVRKIKQFNNAANMNAVQGNMKMFEFWTMKANVKLHELHKKMGLPKEVDIITMQGTSKQIILLY